MDPSPTIATVRPPSWSRLTTHLVGGQHLGDLGDADPVGDRARHRRVVAGEQDRGRAQPAQGPPPRRWWFDRVGDGEHPRAFPSQATGRPVCPAAPPARPTRASSSGRPRHCRAGRPSDEPTAWPSTTPHPHRRCSEVGHWRQVPTGRRRSGRRPATGCSEGAPRPGRAPRRRPSLSAATSTRVMVPVVTVPVVEHDRVTRRVSSSTRGP